MSIQKSEQMGTISDPFLEWPKGVDHNHYNTKSFKIMLIYDLLKGKAKNVLVEFIGKHRAKQIVKLARNGMKLLIPKIPNIGGKSNKFSKYLLMPLPLMPIVYLMKQEGLPTREIGHFILKATSVFYRMFPKSTWKSASKKAYTEEALNEWREISLKTQKREYPENWVCEFVEPIDGELKYGLNMKECGLKKFWTSQGLAEFVPYLCLTDFITWGFQGLEVHRTKTIANGHDVCDYRFIGYCAPNKDNFYPWPPDTKTEWSGSFEKKEL